MIVNEFVLSILLLAAEGICLLWNVYNLICNKKGEGWTGGGFHLCNSMPVALIACSPGSEPGGVNEWSRNLFWSTL